MSSPPLPNASNPHASSPSEETNLTDHGDRIIRGRFIPKSSIPSIRDHEISLVRGSEEMNVSHASVHPVEDASTTEVANLSRVRMKDRTRVRNGRRWRQTLPEIFFFNALLNNNRT
ncbi:hypothetical protein TIFTF001_034482 [Ficus carica]|uniref:Uncharacterized protein n=1 Tax=Ficus carica TaxID=3494 RepID=A0AA88J8M6_FICCA|nr:hypothetical protein TIFTF001_034482 [Ficus carica]